MIRGTTPTHIFKVPDIYTALEYEAIYITYTQHGAVKLEKDIEDVTVEHGAFTVRLTQTETLGFEEGAVEVQIRAKTTDGEAIASKVIRTTADRVLKGGEI